MYEDENLLPALRRRDPAAFAHLFETFSDKIYRLAVGLLDDDAEAEGIVQDAFLRLFERLDQFEGRSQLGTWLYRVAYNLAIDRLRQRRPHVRFDTLSPEDSLPQPVILADWRQVPERLLTEAELTQELDQAIASLPETYRAVFILREIEGLSTQETADITNLSASNVKVRLHRARLLLRERLAESFVASAS